MSSVHQVLEDGPPYPQVILPRLRGYWVEDPETPAATPNSGESSCYYEEDEEGMNPGGEFGYRLESNYGIQAYRNHFLGKVSIWGKILTNRRDYYCNYIWLCNRIVK